jgi:uncharacterized damage-inducible protein DinB
VTDRQSLLTHLSYSEWATGKLLDYASTLSADAVSAPLANSHGGILKTFQHIFYADRIWLGRVTGQVRTAFEDPPPGPSLEEMRARWSEIMGPFRTWVSEADLAAKVAYRNLKGDPYELEGFKIVLHVVNHGTYHRGQVASLIRQQGGRPPSTDILFYYLDLK